MFLRSWMMGFGMVALAGGIARADGTTTDGVVSYVPGVISSPSLQVNGNAAVGLPASVDDGETSPFAPPFHASSIVIVGGGGSIVLHFTEPVVPGDGTDIGVFTNTGLVAKTVNGVITAATSASGKASVLSSDAAIISVSENNDGDWVTLSGGALLDLTIPSNAFTDGVLTTTHGVAVSGGVTGANPYQPFTGTLTDFAGLSYPQMLTLFNGSFGGAWVDASGTGLSEINYIRFDVPPGSRLVLDAVTAANAVPEPGAVGLLVVGLGGLMVMRRRWSC